MTTQKLASDGLGNRQLSDVQLDVVNGGFSISVCVEGYCASAGTDGFSFGKTGESAGTQVYNAVMKGMGNHKA